MTSKRIPVAQNLFAETPRGPRLLGSRCKSCKAPYFPRADVCRNPECDRSPLEPAEFGPRGTVWSVAMQDYEPPAPVKFDRPYKPYAMGVVDLADGLRVVGRIAIDDPRQAEPGMKVDLVIEAIAHDGEGNELVSWKFRPVAG